MKIDYLIPIIIGSPKDNIYAQKIVTYLMKYENIIPVIRICSAHKAPKILLSMLEEYEDDNNVYVYITIAGKSNALSALIKPTAKELEDPNPVLAGISVNIVISIG